MSALNAASNSAAPVGDIQLGALWHAVRRSFKGLVLAAGVAGAAVYGVQSLMASRFTSESQLEFVAKRNNPLPEAGDRPGGPDQSSRLDQAAINTHARALLSSDLLLKVADTLKLRNRVEFNGALGPLDTWSSLLRLGGIGAPLPGETEEERVLSVVRRQLVVAAIKDTRWIGISFTSADSQLAADFANTLAETYRSSLVAQPIEETGKAVEALIPKVNQLRKEVLDAEGEVERYRTTSDQFKAGPQSTPVNDQRMAGLQDELLKVEAARNETESRWRTARELLQTGSAEVLPDVQKSALIQGLIQQRVRLERQIAEASAALLPGHPRMQQLNADVAGLKRQITAEVQKVVQSIEKDARSSALRVEAVQRQIEQLKTKVVDQTGNEARLKELESVARSKRTELERLQKQLEDNRTVVNIRQVPIEAQIISRAMPSALPTSPRKGSSSMLAAAATVILGLAFVITKALVTTPVHGHAPAPRAPGPLPTARPARAVEPELALAAEPEPRATPASKPAPVVADLKALVHRLTTRTDITAGARTLVAGTAPGIDPVPQALAFANTLAAAGKRVVLIGWSLSGQQIGMARTSIRKPGLCDLLAGSATFEQIIGRMPGSSVHVIQPGIPPADPGIVLEPDRLNLTLDALDEAYEQIVVAAEHRDAQLLFEVIEGRFDAAVVVTDSPSLHRPAEDGSETLLGFEVSGIDIVHVPAGAVRPRAASPGRTAPARGAERHVPSA